MPTGLNRTTVSQPELSTTKTHWLNPIAASSTCKMLAGLGWRGPQMKYLSQLRLLLKLSQSGNNWTKMDDVKCEGASGWKNWTCWKGGESNLLKAGRGCVGPGFSWTVLCQTGLARAEEICTALKRPFWGWVGELDSERPHKPSSLLRIACCSSL